MNIEKARQVRGWNPQHRLHDVIPKMNESLKRDLQSWYEINHLSRTGLAEACLLVVYLASGGNH